MAAGKQARIVEVYRELRWQEPNQMVHLDVATARLLRADGITMVRVLTPLRERLFRAPRRTRTREVSLARYLTCSDGSSAPALEP